MTRYANKHAGAALPLSVGAMVPGIAEKAVARAKGTAKTLDQASDGKLAADISATKPGRSALSQMLGSRFSPSMQMEGGQGGLSRLMNGLGGGARSMFGDDVKGVASAPLHGVASGISGGIGESIKRLLVGREFGERKDPLHMGGSAAISAFGKEMGTTGANLLRDIANKAMESAGHAGDEAARAAILGDLKRTDSVLSTADDKMLMETYHTMARFAPVLSTDKNAVRSFLRQAVMSGSGPDYMSIKLIADSERSVTGGKDKR